MEFPNYRCTSTARSRTVLQRTRSGLQSCDRNSGGRNDRRQRAMDDAERALQAAKAAFPGLGGGANCRPAGLDAQVA